MPQNKIGCILNFFFTEGYKLNKVVFYDIPLIILF